MKARLSPPRHCDGAEGVAPAPAKAFYSGPVIEASRVPTRRTVGEKPEPSVSPLGLLISLTEERCGIKGGVAKRDLVSPDVQPVLQEKAHLG